MSEKILVFIPMYNCEKQIVRVLQQFTTDIKHYIDEVLIVNNRSTDNGEAMAISKIKTMKGLKVSVVRNTENYGLGGSHKIAFQYAIRNSFDYVIVLHGDDQGNINDILPFLIQGLHRKVDCLLGARFHPASKLQGYSRFRTFGNYIYNMLFSIVTKHRIYDLGSGLNCYKVDRLKDNFYHQYPDDLTFNYCMILGSIYFKHSIHFFPLVWREDDQVSNVKMIRQAFKVLALLLKFAINKSKFLQNEHREKVIMNYDSELIFKNFERDFA
ncbi:glycosyltransferase family 2 protein [Paenibacillus cisolokensis]|uniref:glycosyltransferase family 2 protein n=1 Tax=Paenibacillus cisolokensis TaxID=1658519 RepID=UPI003D2886B6